MILVIPTVGESVYTGAHCSYVRSQKSNLRVSSVTEAAMSDQPPTIEAQARSVFTERADMYVQSPVHADPAGLARLVELVQPQPTWRMLDVATGTGQTALAFAPYVHQVIGIDLTPRMVEEAARQAAGRGVANVDFVLGDIHELPFDDETFDDEQFDLITCRRAAHHFSHIEDALSEMVRMLKPDGLLLIDDRSVPEDDFVDSVMNRLDWLHDESHVRQYRPSEWRRMLESAGCRVLRLQLSVKHRPVTAFTARVSEGNVQQIHALLAGLSPEQRNALKLEECCGEPYLNHWYVVVLARKLRANTD